MKKVPSLKDLINFEKWQKIQDHFSNVMGISIRTVGVDGTCFTVPSREARLCNDVMTSTALGKSACQNCHLFLNPNLKDDDSWKDGYQCVFGPHNFAIPIRLPDGRAVSYILLGPVFLGERQKPTEYRKKIEELGLDFDKFIDALIDIKVFSFSGIRSVLELLKDVATYLVEAGYYRYKLDKFSSNVSTDKLLKALLDVSSEVVEADQGSIMLVDHETGDLYIKIAKGIDKDIVRDARVKIGEGVAGFAAKNKRLLFLDSNIKDDAIKDRLKRPELKASIVAPIESENELLGVINLGSFNPSGKFTPKSVDTLHQMVKLVAATFGKSLES